jgi:Holliday junction DNA helicase RuvA
MFYYIEGKVALLNQNLVVIDVGGIGYACHTSQTTIASVQEGAQVKLYTYLYVREDVLDLYGFASEEERNCFQLLIGISGVGPKAALNILSVAPPQKLVLSIMTGDEKILTQAQGIGKKIAQRIVLELRDKMAKEQMETAVNAKPVAVISADDQVGEAVSALMVLGYSQSEAMQAMNGLELSEMQAEDIIRQCLKRLARQ